MEIVRATFLERKINDTLWIKIVLVMTYIQYLRPTQVLKTPINYIELQIKIPPDLYHLCILDSNIYVFLHKKEQSLKLAK